MTNTGPRLTELERNILEVLKAHPNGLDIVQLRELVPHKGNQEHFSRRLRELYKYYEIERFWQEGRYIYRYVRAKEDGEYEDGRISKRLRAKILTRDGRRCQMCGRTVSEDKVKLHLDHKIPQSWGGKPVEENLWALCSACNEGKQAYFSNFESETMTKIMHLNSVHARIAALLKLKMGEWVESDLIEFVANYQDYQKDWMKRLRELRYLGLEIESTRQKVGNRTVSLYRLTKWVDLPDNPSAAAREYERRRAQRNRRQRPDW